jgi:acyl dehydratase
MAVRGVYSKEEKEFLEKFEELADKMSGWRWPLLIPVATKEAIVGFAMAADYWNPLWRDENYAANTRWGSIIAPPMFLDADAQITYSPEVPRSLGFGGGQWLGEDWEFFKQVHVGDSFKVWCRRPKLVDITSSDGKGPRAFQFHAHNVDIINQKEEIVSTTRLNLEIVISTEPPPKLVPEPSYSYTKEELAFIDRVFSEEEIRGAKIRWWEGVKVGEALKPVIMGPTTVWDQIVFTAGRREIVLMPMMEVRRQDPKMLMLDPETGVTHHGIEFHHIDPVAQMRGLAHAIHYGVTSRSLLARCATNWMGDDAFMKRFHWRHLGHFYIGETAIARGKVTGKRVENDEHLVDLSLWIENIRGDVTCPAVTTISLLSKEAL